MEVHQLRFIESGTKQTQSVLSKIKRDCLREKSVCHWMHCVFAIVSTENISPSVKPIAGREAVSLNLLATAEAVPSQFGLPRPAWMQCPTQRTQLDSTQTTHRNFSPDCPRRPFLGATHAACLSSLSSSCYSPHYIFDLHIYMWRHSWNKNYFLGDCV